MEAGPDDTLARNVRLLLLGTRYASLRSLQVCVEQGVVRLTGQVGTFYEKQLAQESVRGEPGVQGVVNLVEVAQAVSDRAIPEPPEEGPTT